MKIAYSSDENYAKHAYISLHTLLDNNKQEPNICIYYIDNKLSLTTKKNFEELVEQYNSKENIREIKFIDFLKYEPLVRDAAPCGSISTYGRLFLPELEELDKILYIDCDTICCGSLREFYDTDIDGYAVAGVQDIVGLNRRKEVGLQYGDRYINAGVILMNLKYWRENNGTQICLDFINEHDGKVAFEDQGTINGVFRNKILILPPRYNVMNSMLDYSADKISYFMQVENYYNNDEIMDANKNPIVVHFTAGYYLRPWTLNSNHPKAYIYKDYLARSPWKNETLQKGKSPSFYSKLNRVLRLYMPLKIYKGLRKLVLKIRN